KLNDGSLIQEGQLTLVDQCEFNQCETGYDGSGILANLVSGGHMTMSGSFSFIDCKGTSTSAYGLGGGLYAYTNNEDCSLIFQGSMTFDRCQSVSGGGGAYLRVSNSSILIMSGSYSFTDCSSGGNGGGLSITTLGKGYDINLQASMQFDGCKSGGYGGGLHIQSLYAGQITINQMSFSDCNSTDSGGGAYSLIGYGAQMTITGKMSFYDCYYQETERYFGGGQFLEARIQQSLINVTGELEYNKCEAYNLGGGLYIVVQGNSTIEINKASFTDCLSNQDGGGLALLVYTGCQFTIYGTVSVMNCNSSRYGGGIYLEINNGNVSINPTEQILIENCNSLQHGGGIYCPMPNKGKIQVNNTKFKNCNSERNGGGIYTTIQAEGQLILDNLCELSQCKSNGNGGGIYATVDFTTQCTFIIKDAFIHDCKALNNTSLSYPESGFGGGIFLGGSKNYNPSSKLIDLHGMKINGNKADKFGNSLFVAIPKVVEWCQYGILGEYVKGNYSDSYSDESDLEGIPMNITTFNSSTSLTIEQQQQPLEHWWRILGILNRAQVVVNISNPNGKLLFHIEGQREIPNDQTASFGMNEYKWLNYKRKIYAVLISNDRNIFTGKDGHDIEEDSNAAVPLEVIIEEEDEEDETEIDDPGKEDDPEKKDDDKKDDQEEQGEKEQKGKELPIGAIIGIVFGILAFIALIIIIVIVAIVFASKKKSEKENKQQNNEQQLTDLSAIVEPSKSSANNNQMSQIQSLHKVNSQVQSFDFANTSDQPYNISYPKVQQTFSTKSQVQPSNIAISKAQSSIKPVSKVQSYYIPNSRVKMSSNQVKQQSVSQSRLPPFNQQQFLARTPPLNQQQTLVATPPFNQQQFLARTPPLNQQQTLVATPPFNQQQSLITTPPFNQQQSLITTPPFNQQQSLVRTPPLNQQQSLVTTPPLNQQQSLVTTPPLNQQQSLDMLSPLNDNIVLHQRSNGNMQTDNRFISRGVLSGKK
ncbi:MAG: hypothetical protein EZS28_025482, partial [Streblomastix strix]